MWNVDDEDKSGHNLRGKKRAVRATPPKVAKGEQSGCIATPPKATKKQGVPTNYKLFAKPKPKPKPKPRAKVSKYWICGVCDQNIMDTSPSIEYRGQGCDSCGVFWHLKCIGLTHKPRWGLWICEGCKQASQP